MRFSQDHDLALLYSKALIRPETLLKQCLFLWVYAIFPPVRRLFSSVVRVTGGADSFVQNDLPSLPCVGWQRPPNLLASNIDPEVAEDAILLH